jgi:hypothetical protein
MAPIFDSGISKLQYQYFYTNSTARIVHYSTGTLISSTVAATANCYLEITKIYIYKGEVTTITTNEIQGAWNNASRYKYPGAMCFFKAFINSGN